MHIRHRLSLTAPFVLTLAALAQAGETYPRAGWVADMPQGAHIAEG